MFGQFKEAIARSYNITKEELKQKLVRYSGDKDIVNMGNNNVITIPHQNSDIDVDIKETGDGQTVLITASNTLTGQTFETQCKLVDLPVVIGDFGGNDSLLPLYLSGHDGANSEGWDLNGDGQLGLWEANVWYRNGKGVPITVDAANITITNVKPSELSRTRYTPINFFFRGPYTFGLVYGTLDLKLVGNNQVQIKNNEYDFETGADDGHPWFESWGGFGRNLGTIAGNTAAGLGDSYMINFVGYANLNYQPPYVIPPVNPGVPSFVPNY